MTETTYYPNGDQYQEPEGIDLTNESVEQYPIDSFMIRTEARTVFDVMRRIENKQFILDPDFQRDFVWEVDKQSRLIESVLMRIPLPVFYLAEDEAGKTIVVDGLQRLTTFYRYINNDFALTALEKTSPQLQGKKFKDLEPKLKNRIEDTNLTLYLIDAKAPERAKLDIFERVNSGVPLTRQQMRNSLYQGPATIWLKKQAEGQWFLEATTGSLNPKTMRDRELINRFCGFYLFGVNKYRGDMDEFLAQTLKYMNKMPKPELTVLGDKFQLSMRNNHSVFDKYAFRKHTSMNERRSVINAALFDVFSVVMTKYENEFIQNRIDTIRSIFYELMRNPTFTASITSATNDVRRVKIRFEIMTEALQEL